MIRYKTKTKEEFCQSRFYKDWNPDYMADYNRSGNLKFIVGHYLSFQFSNVKVGYNCHLSFASHNFNAPRQQNGIAEQLL